jgi:hypothetical protein
MVNSILSYSHCIGYNLQYDYDTVITDISIAYEANNMTQACRYFDIQTM